MKNWSPEEIPWKDWIHNSTKGGTTSFFTLDSMMVIGSCHGIFLHRHVPPVHQAVYHQDEICQVPFFLFDPPEEYSLFGEEHRLEVVDILLRREEHVEGDSCQDNEDADNGIDQ